MCEKMVLNGERNAAVIEAYNESANTHASKGEYDEAIKFYEKVLKARAVLFGERNVDVATS